MIHRYIILIPLAAFLFCCASKTGYANNNTGTVSGQVVFRWRINKKRLDPRQDPVPGVSIRFAGPFEKSSAVTEDDGSFKVQDILAGDWTLTTLYPPPHGSIERLNQINITVTTSKIKNVKIELIRPISELTVNGAMPLPGRIQLVFYRRASLSKTAEAWDRTSRPNGAAQADIRSTSQTAISRIIKGRILDPSKRPVNGATVNILGAMPAVFTAQIKADELTDPSALAAKLQRGGDPVSQYLRTTMSSETKRLLEAYDGSASGPVPLREILLSALNRALDDPELFDKQRFVGVKLSAETQLLAVENTQSGQRARLNRLLLEDAYPTEISRSRRLPPRFVPLGEKQTNESGYYEFELSEDKRTERYLLLVNHSTYYPYTLYLSWVEDPAAEIVLNKVTVTKESDEVAQPSFDAARRAIFLPELMQTLPVSGQRSFDYFALLAPGVLLPPETVGSDGPGLAPGVGTTGQFTVNGLRSRENNFTVDGSDNNDEDIGARRQGFVWLTPQPIESLQEFQIITALADARFGRNLGGQINALTRSGSDGLHGDIYGFFTHDRFNARNFFDQSAGRNAATSPLRRELDNTPVLLDGRPLVVTNPVGGKDKLARFQGGVTAGTEIDPIGTFFFGSFERTVTRATKESHFAVPTIAQRGLFDTGETGAFVNDVRNSPASGGIIFPANVPGSAIFSLFPFPNNPVGPYGRNTYSAVLPADADGTRFSAKMTKQFGSPDQDRKFKWWHFLWATSGDTLTGRYNFTQEKSVLPVTGGAIFSSLRPRVRTQNVAFFFNRTIMPTLTDTLRFSVGRTRLSFDEVRDASLLPSTFFPDTPFLLNAPLLLNVTQPNPDGTLNPTTYATASSPQGAALLGALGYRPTVTAEEIAGPLGQVIIPGFSPLGVDTNFFPQGRVNNTFQIADTLIYTRGKQTYYFGFDVRKTQINSTQDRGFRPQAVFNGLVASRPLASRVSVAGASGPAVNSRFFDGSTLAALGTPTGMFQTLAVVPNSDIGLRFTQVNLFLQDEWRLRPNLSLTLGLRYEVNTVPDTVNRRLERSFDPVELDTALTAALPQCIRERGDADCNNVAQTIRSAFPADFRLSFGADRNDFDLRLGFAWDPNNSGRTVLRGGFGSYSGQFNGLILGQSRNAFPDFLPLNFAAVPRLGNNPGDPERRFYLYNPSNPNLRMDNQRVNEFLRPGTLNTIPAINPIDFLLNRLPLGNSSVGLDLVLPQRELTTPYSLQYGLTLEHVLGDNYLVSVAYVGTRGLKLLRTSTPENGINLSQLSEAFNGSLRFGPLQAGEPRNLFPFPFVDGTILAPQEIIRKSNLRIARTFFESSASSRYNSLQAEVRKRYSRFFQFGTAFTYSHSTDDASDYLDTAGSFALPQNSLLRSEFGPSSFDARVRSATNFIVDLPLQWQVAGIITAQTGQPFTINTGFDVNRDGNLTDRLNSTDGIITDPVTGDNSIRLLLASSTDRAKLLAMEGRDGVLGRNSFRARGRVSFDMSAARTFELIGERQFQFRVEVFNLFNRANFAIPERILESPAFGRSVRTITPARTIQFGLKLSL